MRWKASAEYGNPLEGMLYDEIELHKISVICGPFLERVVCPRKVGAQREQDVDYCASIIIGQNLSNDEGQIILIGNCA